MHFFKFWVHFENGPKIRKIWTFSCFGPKNEPFSWDEYPEYSIVIEQQHPIHDGRPFNPELDDEYWEEDIDYGGWGEEG